MDRTDWWSGKYGVWMPPERLDALRTWEEETNWVVGKYVVCPRVALHSRRCESDPGPGMCSTRETSQVFDHMFRLRWKDDPKLRALLTMPYRVTSETLGELASWCEREDAVWLGRGGGWWHPMTMAFVVIGNREHAAHLERFPRGT